MPGTTKRREATKSRLVQAAIGEFAARGIDATSVEQLCEAAGFSRGAFYSNFETKDDLCIEIVKQVSDEAAELFEDALANLPDEIDPNEIVPTILAVRSPSPELKLTQIEMELRASRNPAFRERFEEVRRGVWPAYNELIAHIAERAGIEFLIDQQDLLYLFDALYSYTGGADEARLIALIARHFVKVK